MANHIDHTYFINEIHVPNAKNNNPGAPIPNGGELESMIAKHEPKMLECLFGYKMYSDYAKALVENEETIDNLPAIWKNIRVGAEYTCANGMLRKWKGFVNNDKVSPIANYVFVQLLSHRASQMTGVGTKATATENSVAVAPIYKQVPAWNEMVDMLIELHQFLIANQSDYPDYVGIQYNPSWYHVITDALCSCSCNYKLFKKRNTWDI